MPSSKFLGLPIPKIWLIFGHVVKRPGDLDLRTFHFRTGAEMSAVARTTVLQILVFLRLVVVEIWEIWANTLQTDDVTSTLTFDLSISKWGHGSPLSWASFLPIFSFINPSILDFESGTGQTDRRTDTRRPSTLNAPTLWGGT